MYKYLSKYILGIKAGKEQLNVNLSIGQLFLWADELKSGGILWQPNSSLCKDCMDFYLDSNINVNL